MAAACSEPRSGAEPPAGREQQQQQQRGCFELRLPPAQKAIESPPKPPPRAGRTRQSPQPPQPPAAGLTGRAACRQSASSHTAAAPIILPPRRARHCPFLSGSPLGVRFRKICRLSLLNFQYFPLFFFFFLLSPSLPQPLSCSLCGGEELNSVF